MAQPRQCRRVREWLPEYAEGALSGSRGAAVGAHVAACARCAEEVAELRTVLTSLHAVGHEALPEHVLASIRGALRQPEARARRLPRLRPAPSLWARLAVPMAAATGLVAIAFALHQGSAPEPKAMQTPMVHSAPETAPAPEPPVAAAPKPPSAEAPMRPVRGGRRPPGAVPRSRPMKDTEAPTREAYLAPEPASREDRQLQSRVAKAKEKAEERSPAPTAQQSGAERGAAVVMEAPALTTAPSAVGGPGGGGRGGAAPPAGMRSRRGPRINAPTPRYGHGGRPVGRRSGHPARRYRGSPASDRVAAAKAPGGTMAAFRPPANAVVVQTKQGQAIALRLEPSLGRKVKVYAGNQVLRPTEEASAGRVLLPTDSMGPTPAQMPIRVSSEVGDWKYTLFTPGLGQLGKQQSAATKTYARQSLAQVLSDLSAASGLVLLVEGRTDTPVEGELSLASPKGAVERLAEAAKLEAYTEDGVVYTLRPQR